MAQKELTVEEILERSLWIWPDDVRPIVRYLGMEGVSIPKQPRSGKAAQLARDIAAYLCKMGSNDFATFLRGGEGIPYETVVLDVGRKLKAAVNESASAAKNEEAILEKLFADALKNMTDEEKRALLKSMNLNTSNYSGAAAPLTVAALQAGLRQFGGFAVYRLSIVAANLVSRAILGTGLSFATNAAISRTIGMALGPIGWIATGAWLAVELAGPAFTKTVPAVVHIAFLRQMLVNRVTIGVVGDGSTGKDSMLKAVFGIDTGQIDPVAGSTTEALVYVIDPPTGAVSLINYPGFNDIRDHVNRTVEELLGHTDLFALVVDVSRGVSKTDVAIHDKLKVYQRPVLVCANKIDLARNAVDRQKLLAAVARNMNPEHFVPTAFDPDQRLGVNAPVGVDEVQTWIRQNLKARGKAISHVRMPHAAPAQPS